MGDYHSDPDPDLGQHGGDSAFPSRTIAVASGRLTASGFDTTGVGEEPRTSRTSGTKPDSPAGPGRLAEVGNSIVGSCNSV